MNIGIDIDDTISKTFEIVCELAKKYNTEELKRNEDKIEKDYLGNDDYFTNNYDRRNSIK